MVDRPMRSVRNEVKGVSTPLSTVAGGLNTVNPVPARFRAITVHHRPCAFLLRIQFVDHKTEVQ